MVGADDLDRTPEHRSAGILNREVCGDDGAGSDRVGNRSGHVREYSDLHRALGGRDDAACEPKQNSESGAQTSYSNAIDRGASHRHLFQSSLKVSDFF
jgi:hypothetical protein